MIEEEERVFCHGAATETERKYEFKLQFLQRRCVDLTLRPTRTTVKCDHCLAGTGCSSSFN